MQERNREKKKMTRETLRRRGTSSIAKQRKTPLSTVQTKREKMREKKTKKARLHNAALELREDVV